MILPRSRFLQKCLKILLRILRNCFAKICAFVFAIFHEYRVGPVHVGRNVTKSIGKNEDLNIKYDFLCSRNSAHFHRFRYATMAR